MQTKNLPQSERQEKTAILIDTQKLSEQCIRLEGERKKQNQIIEQQRQTITNLQKHQSRLAEFAKAGEEMLNHKKSEILSRLRAIVYYTGDERRLQILQSKLNDPECTSTEVNRLHQSIQKEFQTLYPNKAISTQNDQQPFDEIKPADWSSYRIE